MRFALVSDIHLECMDKPARLKNLVTSDAEVLILAGDIGHPSQDSYWELLQDAADAFVHVFVVAGNHEYYAKDEAGRGLEQAEVNRLMDEAAAAAGPNVSVLRRGRYVEVTEKINTDTDNEGDDVNTDSEYNLKTIKVLGCTLWTSGADEKELEPGVTRVEDKIRDFKAIPGLTPKRYRAQHEADRAWLKSQLQLDDCDVNLVVTHHLPTLLAHNPARMNSSKRFFYASDCEDLMAMADVWCCGHSHYKTEIQLNGCMLYNNPLGRPGEKEVARLYDPNFNEEA
jgi:predicted phosphodiesterase